MHILLPLLFATAAVAVPVPYHLPEGIFGHSDRRHNLTWDTQDDLKEGMDCKPVTLIYARGTWAGGNMGDHIGPALAKSLGQKVGVDNIAVQGVDYPASVPGFLHGGSGSGSEEMRELTGEVMNRCPDTNVVLAGYSQGAQVVHKAVDWMHPDFVDRISSIVTFGDPKSAEEVKGIDPSKVRVYCHDNDLVCQGKPLVGLPHWDYSKQVEEAAHFSAEKVKESKGFWSKLWDSMRGY